MGMKKTLFSILLLVFVGSACVAQKKYLMLNEDNKYTYYQVRETAAGAEVTERKILDFLKSGYPNIKIKQRDAKLLTGNGKLVIYKSSIVGHEEGEIDFDLNFELKEQKYRYWFTNFVFAPYQRNRYNVYERANGLNYPLEKDAMFKKVDQERYLDMCGSFCHNFDNELKAFLSGKNIARTAKDSIKRISTKNW